MFEQAKTAVAVVQKTESLLQKNIEQCRGRRPIQAMGDEAKATATRRRGALDADADNAGQRASKRLRVPAMRSKTRYEVLAEVEQALRELDELRIARRQGLARDRLLRVLVAL